MAVFGGPAVLAHLLTQHYELGVSPLLLGVVAFGLVFGAGQMLWLRRPAAPAAPPPSALPDPADAPPPCPPPSAPPGPAAPPHALRIVTRIAGVALLALAISAGLLGREEQVFNIAPALAVGGGWPLLVLASLLIGGVWTWIDPFDSLARVLAPLGAGDGTGAEDQSVWPAVGTAALLVAYLTVYPDNLAPPTVGAALLAYVLVTLAGCLALGRRAWLARAEILGLFFGWLSAARQAATWGVRAGAAAVLSVLAGGFAYGLLRDSRLLANYLYGPPATRNGAIALTVCVVLVAAATGLSIRQHPAADRAVTLALTIAAGGLALALAMSRNRFTTSLQLVPMLATDPFGTAPDLLEIRVAALALEPVGATGLRVAQMLVLGVTHTLAGMAAVRRAARDGVGGALPPGLMLTSGVAAAAVAAIAAT